MARFFISLSQVEGDLIHVEGQTLNHLKNVLRTKPGEEVTLLDGSGKEYLCVLKEYLPGEALCSITSCLELSRELPIKLTLFQALPKADKMDLIVQKAVELGAYGVVPVETARCVVRLDDKKAAKKQERWQAIAASAAEQSKRSFVPGGEKPLSFADALGALQGMDLSLLPYELEQGMGKTKKVLSSLRPGMRVGIFIGPEGGFEAKEVEEARAAGAVPISLGKRILRTETAGMALLAHLMLMAEEWESEEKDGEER